MVGTTDDKEVLVHDGLTGWAAVFEFVVEVTKDSIEINLMSRAHASLLTADDLHLGRIADLTSLEGESGSKGNE